MVEASFLAGTMDPFQNICKCGIQPRLKSVKEVGTITPFKGLTVTLATAKVILPSQDLLNLSNLLITTNLYTMEPDLPPLPSLDHPVHLQLVGVKNENLKSEGGTIQLFAWLVTSYSDQLLKLYIQSSTQPMPPLVPSRDYTITTRRKEFRIGRTSVVALNKLEEKTHINSDTGFSIANENSVSEMTHFLWTKH
ncbi:unnamed protein product [Orchesella dallaii]|uniref:Uncharacterized protein n=1 Tax=Orchesella dallaii TaxID=48710 RepID=A0ABP1R481_9HEXA